MGGVYKEDARPLLSHAYDGEATATKETLMAGLGTTEILIIAAVLILLFGAKKLPDLARGSGRALRIFKSETKGLMTDDDPTTDPHGRPLPPSATTGTTAPPPPVAPPPAQPSPQDSTYRDPQY
jgi:sec-independent protein translocase protein TatA